MLETNGFINSLKNYQLETVDKLQENLKNISNDILENAKDKAPFDTGELKENSGYYVKSDNNEIVGIIGFMEYYAVYTHQGTGIHALNDDGRKTPWSWFGHTEKWHGWHTTTGQTAKQFLFKAYMEDINIIPLRLKEGV